MYIYNYSLTISQPKFKLYVLQIPACFKGKFLCAQSTSMIVPCIVHVHVHVASGLQRINKLKLFVAFSFPTEINVSCARGG